MWLETCFYVAMNYFTLFFNGINYALSSPGLVTDIQRKIDIPQETFSFSNVLILGLENFIWVLFLF